MCPCCAAFATFTERAYTVAHDMANERERENPTRTRGKSLSHTDETQTAPRPRAAPTAPSQSTRPPTCSSPRQEHRAHHVAHPLAPAALLARPERALLDHAARLLEARLLLSRRGRQLAHDHIERRLRARRVGKGSTRRLTRRPPRPGHGRACGDASSLAPTNGSSLARTAWRGTSSCTRSRCR